jgi:hypothetical protein
MLNHQSRFGLSFLILLLASVGSVAAQQTGSEPAVQPSMQCGGQYECVEDRPLTPAEARASRGYPQVAEPQEVAKDPAKVATTRPAMTN